VAYAKEKYRPFKYKTLSQEDKDALTDQWQIEMLQHLEKTGNGGLGSTEMPAVQVVKKLGRQIEDLVSSASYPPTLLNNSHLSAVWRHWPNDKC
jgi:hypothetical protein